VTFKTTVWGKFCCVDGLKHSSFHVRIFIFFFWPSKSAF